MLRIILLSLLSVLWFSPDAFSQKASVSGEVFCGKSGQPIEYATVAVTDTNGKVINGTVTNAEGHYTIPGLSAGIYSMEVRFIGYEKQRVDRIAIRDKKAVYEVGRTVLSPVSTTLGEVSVTGELKGIEHKVDRQVVIGAAAQCSGELAGRSPPEYSLCQGRCRWERDPPGQRQFYPAHRWQTLRSYRFGIAEEHPGRDG